MQSNKTGIEQWPVSKLIPYVNNPRKNDHAVDQVAAAIHAFGFRVPILAKSDGLIVDGHLRLKAAHKLGMEFIPVILCDDLSDTEIKALRISINKMAELAEWDDELLNLELGELSEVDFDLALVGFDNFYSDENSDSIILDDEGPQKNDEVCFIDCPKCGFKIPNGT